MVPRDPLITGRGMIAHVPTLCSVSSAGERLLYTQRVGGSIPSPSTNPFGCSMKNQVRFEAAEKASNSLLNILMQTQPLTSVGVGVVEDDFTLVVYVRNESDLKEVPERFGGFQVDPHLVGPAEAF